MSYFILCVAIQIQNGFYSWTKDDTPVLKGYRYLVFSSFLQFYAINNKIQIEASIFNYVIF